MQAYATWQVMRRLRASAAAAARPRTPTAHARNNIRAAASLLAWLRGRGTTLAACGQADIDQWLRTGPSACLARDFLTWAASRGHCRRLTIPAPPRATGPAISQDQRWALAARLLHDTALDPTDRVAGCLLLLYGQPLSRIAAMTTSQVTRRDGETFIRLGRHDVPVPGPLASAVLQLISDGRSYRGVGSPPATTWLFPGHLPGRPITPARLGERLRRHRHLRPDRTPRRAARSRRPAPRRGPRRPPRPAPDDRRQVDAPSRRRLVPLRSRASPPSSPALTNTSPHPGPQSEVFSMVGNPLPTSSELGLPVHVLQRYAGHATPTMVMQYIAQREEHAEQAFLATVKLKADGTRVAFSREDHDIIHLLGRADRILPNGWCLLPPLQSCGKGNACLTCSVFVTDQTHQQALERQLADTAALIDRATTDFAQRHGRPMPADNVWLAQRQAEHAALTRLLAAMQAAPGRAVQGAGCDTAPAGPVPVTLGTASHRKDHP